MFVFAGLAMLPDVDVVCVAFGVPDCGAPGHRGFTHSIAFALAVGALGVLWAKLRGGSWLSTGLLVLLAVGSHGLLDTLTHEGRGIPFFWPLSDERFKSPFRPIPDAPTGLRFISMRGLHAAWVEAIYFAPLFLWSLWPRRMPAEAPVLRVVSHG